MHSIGRDVEALKYARLSLNGPSVSADAHYRAGIIADATGHLKLARRYRKVALSQTWTLPVLWRDANSE